MLGYKVVRVHNGRLFSAISHSELDGVEYKLNETTVPRAGDGPLAVFSTKKQAMDFCHVGLDCLGHNFELYKVQFMPSDGIELFKNIPSFGKVVTHVLNALPGTILADSVTLLKKVS